MREKKVGCVSKWADRDGAVEGKSETAVVQRLYGVIPKEPSHLRVREAAPFISKELCEYT